MTTKKTSRPRYRPIPISAAKEIGKRYGKQQVIVVAWDAFHGKEHVTTWGEDAEACRQAAAGGNRVKRALGWPEALCDAKSKSVTELEAALREAVERLEFWHRVNGQDAALLERLRRVVAPVRRPESVPPMPRMSTSANCDCGHPWEKHNHLGCRRALAPGERALTFCACDVVCVPCGIYGCAIPRPEQWTMCFDCYDDYLDDPDAYK